MQRLVLHEDCQQTLIFQLLHLTLCKMDLQLVIYLISVHFAASIPQPDALLVELGAILKRDIASTKRKTTEVEVWIWEWRQYILW